MEIWTCSTLMRSVTTINLMLLAIHLMLKDVGFLPSYDKCDVEFRKNKSWHVVMMLCRCEMARQTVEIDKKLWQKFQKMLVDLYGSAYGSKKIEALNEALDLWLEVKTATVSGKTVEEQVASLLKSSSSI